MQTNIIFYLLFPVISYIAIILLAGVSYLVTISYFVFPITTFFEKTKKEENKKSEFSFAWCFDKKFPKLPILFFIGISFVLKPVNNVATALGMICILCFLLYILAFIFIKVLRPINNLYFFLSGLRHYVKFKAETEYNRSLFQTFLSNYFFVASWFIVCFILIVFLFALLYLGCVHIFSNSVVSANGLQVQSGLFEFFYFSMRIITTIGSDIVMENMVWRIIEITELLFGIFLFVMSISFVIGTMGNYFGEFKEIYDKIKRSEEEPMEFSFATINLFKDECYIGKRRI